MFTFSFSTSFAATTYTAEQVKDALEVEKVAQLKALKDLQDLAVKQYAYDEDGFAEVNSFKGYTSDAIRATMDVMIADLEKKMQTAIETEGKRVADAGGASTIDYSVVRNITSAKLSITALTDYVKDTADTVLTPQKLIDVKQAPISKAYISAKVQAVLANIDKYSAKNAEVVSKLVNDTLVKIEAVETTSANDTMLKKVKAYKTEFDTFKTAFDKIPTLEADKITDSEAAKTVEGAINKYLDYAYNKIYPAWKATEGSAPAKLKQAPFYEAAKASKKANIFGVEVASDVKLTKLEAAAVNDAFFAALKNSADVIRVYAADQAAQGQDPVTKIEALYDSAGAGTPSSDTTFEGTFKAAVNALKKYEEVVALGEEYKATYKYGVKLYVNEAVDQAVKKAKELVYAGFLTSLKDADKYIDDAAKALNISIFAENYEYQKFLNTIEKNIAKMYKEATTTPAEKVSFGEDKTPEEDLVYLKGTYASDAATAAAWEAIASGAVSALRDAESYADIDKAMKDAATSFADLTLRVNQFAVASAKASSVNALDEYVNVQKALKGTVKYPEKGYADILADGKLLINDVTVSTVAEVDEAFNKAKALFDGLKTNDELKALEKAAEEAIEKLPETSKATLADKDAIKAAADLYLEFVNAPGAEAKDIAKDYKLELNLKTIYTQLAGEMTKKVLDMKAALDKVRTISDAQTKDFVALKDDVTKLIAERNALAAEIAKYFAPTELSASKPSIQEATDLLAELGAWNAKNTDGVNGFWDREVHLVELALVAASKDGATTSDMRVALDAFKKLTDRQRYSIDAHALQMVNVIELKLTDAVESMKLRAYSKKSGKGILVKWVIEDGRKSDADGYQVFRSTKKDRGYKKLITVKGFGVKNTKNLKKGTTYYYKVRAYNRAADGKLIFSDWSNKAHRRA